MKAYLTLELEIPDIQKVLTDARIWEKRENYKYDDLTDARRWKERENHKYGDDTEQLIADFILCHDNDNYYNLEDSDLHIVTAKEKQR